MKTFIFPLSKQVVICVWECLRAQNSFLRNLIRSLENVLAACKHMLCLRDNYNCVVTLWKYFDVLQHILFRMRYTFHQHLPHPSRFLHYVRVLLLIFACIFLQNKRNADFFPTFYFEITKFMEKCIHEKYVSVMQASFSPIVQIKSDGWKSTLQDRKILIYGLKDV